MQSLVVPKVSDGVSQTLVRMMKQEGVMRPVRGMPAMIVGAGPAHAFYFSSYEYLKTTMTNHTHSTTYHPLIHGKFSILIQFEFIFISSLLNKFAPVTLKTIFKSSAKSL